MDHVASMLQAQKEIQQHTTVTHWQQCYSTENRSEEHQHLESSNRLPDIMQGPTSLLSRPLARNLQPGAVNDGATGQILRPGSSLEKRFAPFQKGLHSEDSEHASTRFAQPLRWDPSLGTVGRVGRRLLPDVGVNPTGDVGVGRVGRVESPGWSSSICREKPPGRQTGRRFDADGAAIEASDFSS